MHSGKIISGSFCACTEISTEYVLHAIFPRNFCFDRSQFPLKNPSTSCNFIRKANWTTAENRELRSYCKSGFKNIGNRTWSEKYSRRTWSEKYSRSTWSEKHSRSTWFEKYSRSTWSEKYSKSTWSEKYSRSTLSEKYSRSTWPEKLGKSYCFMFSFGLCILVSAGAD